MQLTTTLSLFFATLLPLAAETYSAEGGAQKISIETDKAPDLAEWSGKELAPVVQAWYPKIVKMLPSKGFEAPKDVTISFKEGMGGTPAYAMMNRISMNPEWYRNNLKGEARGATVHELVHVVQQYGLAQRTNKEATKTPGWLVEGIADYIRWYLYEPESKGCEISPRRAEKVNYDNSYRVTANFLNYVVTKVKDDTVVKLNEAAREGKYTEELWKTITGKPLAELGAAWKESLGVSKATTVQAAAEQNKLTPEEEKDGWKLLFNGKDLTGWNNFKKTTIKPGWQVKDGNLACVDPHNASDLCTADQYDWFILELDYNISEGGNSGIIYHVTNEGGAVWATGPEFQLEDNAKAADPQRCGWLYGLYEPPIDPATNKILDATKPAGEWNHVKLTMTKEKVIHEINGVKYFEYVLGSDDFKARVAKSKFGSMPLFAKADKGFLALQGDHGQVTFRNIKIKPLK